MLRSCFLPLTRLAARPLSRTPLIVQAVAHLSSTSQKMATENANELPPKSEPESAAGPSKNELKKRAKEAEKEKKRLEREQRERDEKSAREAADVDYATQNYGSLPMHQSQEKTDRRHTTLANLSKANAGEAVYFRARVQNSRAQGAKMVFFEFRQHFATIQAILAVSPEKVSKQMVKWAMGLGKEALVLVEGVVQSPLETIKSTSVQDAEIAITKIHLAAEITAPLPFGLDDASRPESDYQKEGVQYNRVELPTRMNSRTFDLRTPTNNAIFRVESGVCSLFRSYLDSQGFIEIHSPKLQGAATESGASVFKVEYFNRPAYLAQSPQFAKQMCISADMNRVYEIGPVFRAEDSNTLRHMTEFTGLDLEMELHEHYHEAMYMLDGMLKSIFKGLQEKYAKEIAAINLQFPCDPFQWKEETVVLTFPEAVKMLREAGREVGDYEDFDTPTERFLGELVKKKYETDYYILDKFPSAVRPFYTMPDPADGQLSNSYDFFMRGQEILSGAQRVHHAPLLEKNLREKNIDPEMPGIKEYVDGFRWGCPPHAGGGIGLERVVMLFLQLGNIRYASLFPRDPQSFKKTAKVEGVPGTQEAAKVA